MPDTSSATPEENSVSELDLSLADALNQVVQLKRKVERLEYDLRNRTYQMACLLHMLGGEAKITKEVLDDIPDSGVLHERFDPEVGQLTLQFAHPEEN
jgi:hypothetical protein